MKDARGAVGGGTGGRGAQRSGAGLRNAVREGRRLRRRPVKGGRHSLRQVGARVAPLSQGVDARPRLVRSVPPRPSQRLVLRLREAGGSRAERLSNEMRDTDALGFYPRFKREFQRGPDDPCDHLLTNLLIERDDQVMHCGAWIRVRRRGLTMRPDPMLLF